MNFSFDKIEYFLILGLIPIIYFAIRYNQFWIENKRKQFADSQFITKIFTQNKSSLKLILYVLFVVFITFSLVDILGRQEKIKVKNKTIDIVFAIDVSNSMNTQDIAPNRLEKSKKIINDFLEKTSGNRVGLVVFAGQAYSLIPLTQDYNAVKQYVNTISTDMIQVQGTDLGLAIKESCGLFNVEQKNAKCIVLLSDGEDHGGNENQGISVAKYSNARIISVGIGTLEGKPIPYYSDNQDVGFLTDENGEIVISKLQEKALKKISTKTNGTYFSSINSQEIAQFIDESIKKTNLNSVYESYASEHYYQWFLAISLLLIFIIFLTNTNNELNI